MKKKIVLAGGSGFLGRTLARWLAGQGYSIITLSRHRKKIEGARFVHWDGKNIGDWISELEDAEAVINLTGRSVNCRYNRFNRKEIMDSRVDSTSVLGTAIRQCANPPNVWMNSSTATIYKHTYGQAHTEDGEIGWTREAKDKFSIEVARAWEQTFAAQEAPGTRKIVLRMAMVFGREPGGVFDVLHRLTRWGLGGRMGDGQQYMSWIHATDLCRSINWLLHNNQAEGVYNISAPYPLTNRDMMAALRKAAGIPVGLPATKWMLEVGTFMLRTESELVIKSRNVVPQRLLDEGFDFKLPHVEHALKDLIKVT